MESCECKITKRGRYWCDDCFIEDAKAHGMVPVGIVREHNGKQWNKHLMVECPDCKQTRIVKPANYRRGQGKRCNACAGKRRIGRAHRPKNPQPCLECGEQFVPRAGGVKRCDDCLMEIIRSKGHNPIRLLMVDGTRRVECKCATCFRTGTSRLDDITRDKVRQPWRCQRCYTNTPLTSPKRSA